MQFYPFINRLNVIERTGAARMASKLQSLGERLLKFPDAVAMRVKQLANLLRKIYTIFTAVLLNPDSRSSFSKSKSSGLRSVVIFRGG